MKVGLMVNSECNARCGHCYIPYTGSRSPDNTFDLVVQLQKQGHDVIIAGSETLLDVGYLSSYKQAGQKYLLTNGILLQNNKPFYDLIAKNGIEHLVFSMHFGIEDKLGSVPIKIVKEAVREAKSRGFTTQITTVITSDNYNKLNEMCEEAVRYSANILKFDRFVRMGRGSGLNDYSLTVDQINAFFQQLVDVRRKYQKTELEILAHGNFGPRPGSRGAKLSKQNRYCPAGTDMVAIDPDNLVYGCPFTMHKEYAIGKYEKGRIILERNILAGRREKCIAHLLC